MEIVQIIKALLALIFVLGLLFTCVWMLKYVEQKGVKNRFFQKLNNKRRLEILETVRLDMRNSVVLLRQDNTEYLLLLSNNNSLLLETHPHHPSSQPKGQIEKCSKD